MAQKPQIIDITKSYLPGDPNSFVQNLVNTDKEDGEEKALPVLPYEGYNFLPTAYGYKSYFGINSNLGVGALPSRAQFILLYQLSNFQSRLIALCEDGIWVCNTNAPYSLWVKTITLSYTEAIFQEWTWCVIENVLYMYQQGRSTAWKTYVSSLAVEDWPHPRLLGGSSFLEASARFPAWDVSSVDLTIIPHTPNFLNMTGQMGIFRAGLRLGFWDSSNSVSWSSNLDLTDFTPSLENLAGNTIFGYVVGRIVLCKGHGKGFLVYSTKSIVGVTFASTGNLLWDAKKILDSSGIASSRAVTCGSTDDEHFVYSTSGIYTIGKYNSLTGAYDEKNALPELYDYLRESRDPIALRILQDRYICFSLVNADYIYGKQSFYTGIVDPLLVRINWYIPSDMNPTGTEAILPDQLLEILYNEMSPRRPRRDNRKWVPLYTTEVDRMDTRYYAPWMYFRPGGETTGLLPYSGFDANLNTSPLTAGIVTALDGVPSSDRFGAIRTFAGIRAFAYSEGGDTYDNNETLIVGQTSEWDSYVQHMEANKVKLEAITDTVHTDPINSALYDTGAGYTVLSRDGSSRPTHSTKVLGSFITGEGNIDWLVTKGPTEDAAREVIMRKLFNKVFEVTADVTVEYTGTGSGGWAVQSNNVAPFVDIDSFLWFHSATGSGLASFYQGVNKKTYTINGNPGLVGSYTLINAGGATELVDHGFKPVLTSPSNYYITFAAGDGFYYSINGYVWTLWTPTNINYQVDTIGAEFLGSSLYAVTVGATAVYKYTIVADVVTANTIVSTTGLTLTSTSRKAMINVSGTLYILECGPGMVGGRVKIWSSSDALAWTLVSNTTGNAFDYPSAKILTGTTGRILGSSGSTLVEWKITATTWVEEIIAGSGTNTALYANTDQLYICQFDIYDQTKFTKIYTETTAGYQDATFNYTVAEVTQNSGYSQLRATVTHWDLIEPGLYGNYTLIQRVPAGTMTPKVWDSHYPEDRGPGRDQLWSYASYIAQAAVNLSKGTLGGRLVTLPDSAATPYLTIDGYDQNGITNAHSDFLLPGSSYLLQIGSIETSYSTYVGALVYDIQLKKWGKFKQDHSCLVETTPINTSSNGMITCADLGVNAGILDSFGNIYLFDTEPTDSWIRYGKIGFQRLGMTWSGEVRVSMRYASNFSIEVDSSLTGKAFDMSLSQYGSFFGETEGVFLTDISARWHSVKISGSYDLTGLEVRGTLAGRR